MLWDAVPGAVGRVGRELPLGDNDDFGGALRFSSARGGEEKGGHTEEF
jgi:hypothetical protein